MPVVASSAREYRARYVCDTRFMLQLHFYSNHAGRLVLDGGSSDWWSSETYPLASIKEFEQISEAWKRYLADLLKKGVCVCMCMCMFVFTDYLVRSILSIMNI